MKAYTDASVLETGVSLHSYVIYDETGRKLEENQSQGASTDIQEAELISIVTLLLRCKKMMLRGVSIHTDSLLIVEALNSKSKTRSFCYKRNSELFIMLEVLLEETSSKISWVKRELNKRADKLCVLARKKIGQLKRVILLNLEERPTNKNKEKNKRRKEKLKEKIRNNRTRNTDIKLVTISPPSGLKENGIVLSDLKEKELAGMLSYYSIMVKSSHRKKEKDIFKWGEGRKSVNTRRGRSYFVEQFIQANHSYDELNNKLETSKFRRKTTEEKC